MRSPWLSLALFSSCLSSAQPDWPTPNRTAGFPLHQYPSDERELAILQFLDAGEPAIVAAIGSPVSRWRLNFLRETTKAAHLLGRRLLLIAGTDGMTLAEELASDSVMVVPFASYAAVFHRASALVIAGAAGCVSHALHAGHPMLVVTVEINADQPDNARRLVALGVARSTPFTHYSAGRAVKHLKKLLTQPSYTVNAHRIAASIAHEDGIASACDALESVANSQPKAVHA